MYIDHKKSDNTLDRFALNAVTADKLGTDAGNTNTPVYFEGGIPKAVSYNLSSMQSGIDNAIVGLSVSGTTVTYTRQNGDSGTITTQNTDTKVTQNAVTTSNHAYPVILGYNSSTAKVTNVVNKATSFTYNPSAKILNVPGTVAATTFSGALSGNAATATYATSAGTASTAEAFAAAKSITLSGDITGTSSSTGGWTISTTLASTGVSAGSYGLASAATPAFGASFNVPHITVDAKGRITSAATRTVKLPANPNTTYDLSAPANKTNGNVTIDLKAGGAGSGTDSVTIKGSGATTVSTDANGVITISSTDTNTHAVSSVNGKTGAVSLTHSDVGALNKLTYEWNKEYSAGGTAGYLLIGSFPMYDSNVTIDIDATTSITYHGTVVIATQNVSETSIGSAHTITVYGDPTGTISDAIRVTWASGSRNYNVYFTPSTWSKNLIHIRAIGQYLENIDNSKICTQFTAGTAPATTSGLAVINALKTNFNNYTHPTSSGNKHIPSGGSNGQILRWSADGTAVWGADNNTTYSAGTGLSLSGTTFNHSNSITAKTSYAQSATKSPGYAGTFNVYEPKYDAQGHITGVQAETITMPSAQTIPTAFTITATATDDDVVVLTGTNGSNKVTFDAKHAKKGPSSGYTSGNTTTSISGPGGSGIIKIPQITVDTYGHVTAAADENITITLPTAQDLGLSNALHFIGTVSSLPADTTGYSNGDVILVGNKEYICSNSTWIELGDGSSYALNSITVTGTNGLTGGGALNKNQTISADLVSNTKLTNAASAATEIAGRVYPVAMDKNGKLAVNVPWTDNNTIYSTATSTTAGLVKIGYTTSGKNYGVQLSDGKMFVNVPWTDNNTTYTFSNKAATLSWGASTTIATVGGTDITVSLPSNPNSDTKVTQNAAITTNGNYPVILGYNTSSTAITNAVNKTTTLTYNPSTQTLNTTKLSFSNAVTLSYNSADKSLDFIFA